MNAVPDAGNLMKRPHYLNAPSLFISQFRKFE